MTRPKYKGKRFQLFLGKCENILKELPSNSVHSIVCDPPYELGFMGKSWDASGIAYNTRMWKDAMRVLKPGGYLLAFSGSRTYHRMVCAIEDAGFEIRDQIMWLYGSGFPKSQNVSKAIDKAAGAERKVVGVKPGHENFVGRDSIKSLRKDGALSSDGGFSRPWMHDKEAVDKYHMLTAPATDHAKEWEGWGTALKPAHEPICVARKPFKGTVVKNVLKHRTGAVNIDACRIAGESTRRVNTAEMGYHGGNLATQYETGSDSGRWPANVVHDGSTDVQDAFARFGESKSRKGKPRGSAKPGDGWGMTKTGAEYNDEGSPARFFYCAKASKKDREEGCSSNPHPTVKPTELMRYLVRLVTPPDGIVLDPFMGSGSTGKACMLEGFKFAGIDMYHEYVDLSHARITHALTKEKK